MVQRPTQSHTRRRQLLISVRPRAKRWTFITSFSSVGLGFDRLLLWVQVNDGDPQAHTFSSLTGSGGAETFFSASKNKPLSLGTVAAGPQSVELIYDLTFNIGTSAAPDDGFGFTYDLVDPAPSAAIPEPSTWAMMLVGFAGLAFAGYRARMGCARSPKKPDVLYGSSLCAGYQNPELGFVWQNGVMTALPTLGGNSSFATGANNLGQVVG